MSEVHPTLSCDIGVGTIIDDIDLPVDKVVGYMRDRGFTDEQICEVSIHISEFDLDEISSRNQGYEQKDASYTNGIVIKDEKRIILFPRVVTREIDTLLKAGDEDLLPLLFLFQEETNRLLSEGFSETLAHEIEHLKVAYEEDQETQNATGSLGSLAIGISISEEAYQAYLADPEEIRCRVAAANAPKNLMNVRFKL